jgi:hypothetical protein
MRLSSLVGAIMVVLLTLAPVKVNVAPMKSLALAVVRSIASSAP